MSLNFNFSRTAYFKDLESNGGGIFFTAPNGWGGESSYLLPELDAIVWAANTVGMPSITVKNVGEFINRVTDWVSVAGPIVTRYDEATKDWVDAFDPAVAFQCIGFGCNISPLSKAAFAARLRREAADLATA
jgi:hypothetical protein